MGLTSDAGPNGATTSVVYNLGVPTQTTSPHGAVTSVSLSATAPHKTTATNGNWVRESHDGFGRTVQVETGNSTEGVKSVVSTEDAPSGTRLRARRQKQGRKLPTHLAIRRWDAR